MKKIGIFCILLIGCLFLNGFVCATPETANDITADVNLVKASRFQNMLNLNTVYGDDFYDNEKLVNSAAIVLKNYADEDGFIKNEIVSAYIKDMYDIDIDINEKINEGFPQKQGYVLLIPRGYSEYNHTITGIKTYDDYISVTSKVTVKTHDNGSYTIFAETKFIENEQSIFGYSILNSELTEKITSFKNI